jgi:hypothetical protein
VGFLNRHKLRRNKTIKAVEMYCCEQFLKAVLEPDVSLPA